MKKINSSSIRDDHDYNNISIEIDHIVVNPDKRVYVILTDGERQAGLEITNFEASMLSFVHKELHKNSHINTIHQLFVKLLHQIHTKVESVCIESKVGDVVYASMKTVDEKHNRAFSITSLVDGLILACIENAPIFAVNNVWKHMDEIDEWDYEEYIFDYDPEEDEDED